MRPSALPLLAVPVLIAVPVAGHLRRSRHRPTWKSVTVLADEGGLRREPLDALRGVEVRVLPAPGERGVEVHARYRRPHGPEADFALRTALRDLKQLTETGGVLHVDPRPHGTRKATPQGLLQDEAERVAKGWGLL